MDNPELLCFIWPAFNSNWRAVRAMLSGFLTHGAFLLLCLLSPFMVFSDTKARNTKSCLSQFCPVIGCRHLYLLIRNNLGARSQSITWVYMLTLLSSLGQPGLGGFSLQYAATDQISACIKIQI